MGFLNFKTMRKLKISIFIVIFLLYLKPCFGYSAQALEKVPSKYLYSEDVTNYAKQKFEFSEYEISDGIFTKEAIGAGWQAFNQNFGLQGAVFTTLEECLSLSFLSNINSMLGEVGGALVLLQLGIDLVNKDYKVAGVNFSKGSTFYAIGKWGSRGMRLGVVGAIAVEWYLGKVADILYATHDDFWCNAFRFYFEKWTDGEIALEELKDTFRQSDLQTKEDVMGAIDKFLEKWVWNNLEYIEATYRSGSSGSAGMVRCSRGRLKEKKEEFNKYIKGIIILPYLKPFFQGMVQESIEKYTQAIIQRYKNLIKELNREYKVTGRVIGPKEKIKGLKVKIPGLVETFTDSEGKYEFRLTLYSLMKSDLWKNNKKSSLEIVLEVPEDRKINYFYRRGKIRKKHRNQGLINIKAFELEGFYQKYCSTYLELQNVLYSNLESSMRKYMKDSGQGMYHSVEQCISVLTKREQEIIEIWRGQGESEAKIKEGVEAFRKIYKGTMTSSGCSNFYGAFCKMMGMAAKDAPAEVLAEIKRTINKCVEGVNEGCRKIPETLDW